MPGRSTSSSAPRGEVRGPPSRFHNSIPRGAAAAGKPKQQQNVRRGEQVAELLSSDAAFWRRGSASDSSSSGLRRSSGAPLQFATTTGRSTTTTNAPRTTARHVAPEQTTQVGRRTGPPSAARRLAGAMGCDSAGQWEAHRILMILGQIVFLMACLSYCVCLGLGELLALSVEQYRNPVTRSMAYDDEDEAFCGAAGEEWLRNPMTCAAVFLFGALLNCRRFLQIPVF